MKFCTRVQNFADEWGRVCSEATTIPSEARIIKIAALSNLTSATRLETYQYSQKPKDNSNSATKNTQKNNLRNLWMVFVMITFTVGRRRTPRP